MNASLFEFDGGVITEVQLTTNLTSVGQSDENTATITFTPTTDIPYLSGLIEIETPVWLKIHDFDLNETSDIYQTGSSQFNCSSSSFEELSTEMSQNIVQLKYKNLLQEQLDQVVIECSNWRNPTSPNIIDGFFLRTFDINHDPIDESVVFQLNASTLLRSGIDHSSIQIELGSVFPNDTTSLLLTFELVNQVNVSNECLTRVTFPIEFDLSNLNIFDVLGSGMLSDNLGLEQSIMVDKINVAGQSVTIQGCQYESQEVSIRFDGVTNPLEAVDTSNFLIEVVSDI